MALHRVARGFIQLARSQIAAPVLFREKDRTLRLCVDFRRSMECALKIHTPSLS